MGPSPGVVHDDSGMCLLRDWMKTRHHFPIRKQAEVLLDCLCMNNWPRACLSHWRKEDSSLHGKHVGRVLGLTPRQSLQNSETCVFSPPREFHPHGVLTLLPAISLHLFRTQWHKNLEVFSQIDSEDGHILVPEHLPSNSLRSPEGTPPGGLESQLRPSPAMAVEKLPGLSFLFHQMTTLGSTQQAVVRIKGDNAQRGASLSPDQSSFVFTMMMSQSYKKTLTD